MFLLHPVSQKVASLVAHSKMALCARKAVKRACCDDRCVFWFHLKQEADSFPCVSCLIAWWVWMLTCHLPRSLQDLTGTILLLRGMMGYSKPCERCMFLIRLLLLYFSCDFCRRQDFVLQIQSKPVIYFSVLEKLLPSFVSY